MITVESLTRRYGGFTAVDNVSFTALPGRVTGFLGQNGAGKSTTMRVLVGLTGPTSGTATISGTRFGDAQRPMSGIEQWAAAYGAAWVRSGVVRGNARAERFWERLGYLEARTREGQQMRARTNTIRVMVKPLAGGCMDEYLRLLSRDRPDPSP